jgi:hypothetical protein
MISLKYAIIMVLGAFAAGSFFASPLPQAIAAVIATDVQCTGCVGTPDLAGNAVTAAKIKDGEVKAAEIATDAVGAAEIQGVTKLLFGQCTVSNSLASTMFASGATATIRCVITGVDNDDSASATLYSTSSDGISLCFAVVRTAVGSGFVDVLARNVCSSSTTLGAGTHVAVIVYDK